jgi:hypothetical protein
MDPIILYMQTVEGGFLMSSWTPEVSEHGGYVALARRIQSIISSPKAQIDHQALIAPEPGEARSNWDRLVNEIKDAEGVSIHQRDDGSYLVVWFITPEQ